MTTPAPNSSLPQGALTEAKIIAIRKAAKAKDVTPYSDTFAFARGIESAVRAALASAQPVPQWWRTIESAPEGVLALFCNMRAAELRHTFFVDWVVGGKFCGNRHNTATHWMPIAAAPSLPPAGDVPNTFKLEGESDDAWIDRITGARPGMPSGGDAR